jgi:hypothetical protein
LKRNSEDGGFQYKKNFLKIFQTEKPEQIQFDRLNGNELKTAMLLLALILALKLLFSPAENVTLSPV